MDLRRLEVLVAVSQASSLADAARRLNMTQPGVSHALKALGAEAGFLIARKNGRRLELTPAARRLAEDAATALHCVSVSLEASRAISEGRDGLIRVAFTAATLAALGRDVLKALRAEAPLLRFDVFDMSTDDQVDALRDGRIDAGFLHPPIQADLDVLPLIDEPILVVLSVDHPAARLSPVPLESLRDTPLILFPRARGPALYDRTIAACQRAGFTPRLAESVLAWPAAMTLAAIGFGAAFAPATLAAGAPQGAVARPLVGSPLAVPHALVAPRRPRVAAEQRLFEIARCFAQSWVAP